MGLMILMYSVVPAVVIGIITGTISIFIFKKPYDAIKRFTVFTSISSLVVFSSIFTCIITGIPGC